MQAAAVIVLSLYAVISLAVMLGAVLELRRRADAIEVSRNRICDQLARHSDWIQKHELQLELNGFGVSSLDGRP